MTDTSEERLQDLELMAEVWLAAQPVPLERLLELQPNDTLPLDKDPDGPVDLVVNGTTVATGELVVVDGRFGFRLKSSNEAGIEDVGAES